MATEGSGEAVRRERALWLVLLAALGVGWLANGFAEVVGRYLGVSSVAPEWIGVDDFVAYGGCAQLVGVWIDPLGLLVIAAPALVALPLWRGRRRVQATLVALTLVLSALELGEASAFRATDRNGNAACFVLAFGHLILGWTFLVGGGVRAVWGAARPLARRVSDGGSWRP